MPTKNQTRDFVRKFRIEHDNRIAESLDNPEYELPVAGASNLGGVKIGSGLNITNDGTINVTVENYELPVAGASTLGGVKVGSGLSMNGDSLQANLTADNLPTVSSSSAGLMTAADKAKLDSLNNYTLPTASSTVKGGVKIGSGLSMNGESICAETYTLPTASDTVKGGVKVGSGLSMNGESICAETYTLPTASSTVKGGVKVGSGLNISGDTLSVDTAAVSNAVTLQTASATTKGGVKIGTGCVMRNESLCVMSGDCLVLPATANDDPNTPAQVASIQGGLWGEYIDGVPYLRLRYGDYYYNFGYDSSTLTGGASTTPTAHDVQQYVLGTASVSAQGGLWYTVGSDSAPDLCFHLGNVNFGITHDTQTFVGSLASLHSWLPFDTSTTADLVGIDSWSTVNAAPSIVNDSSAMKGKCLYASGKQLTACTISGANSTAFTVECWVKAGSTVKAAALTCKAPAASKWNYIYVTGKSDGTQTIQWTEGTTSMFTVTVPGGWAHVAWLSDSGENQYRMYVNGKLVYTYSRSVKTFDGFYVYLGNNVTTSGAACYVDEFRYWDKAVWSDEFTPPTAADYVYP